MSSGGALYRDTGIAADVHQNEGGHLAIVEVKVVKILKDGGIHSTAEEAFGEMQEGAEIQGTERGTRGVDT